MHWHGGVDFFLGDQGGSEWAPTTGFRRRVISMTRCDWRWIRGHWQTEVLHHIRDLSYGDDASQIRTAADHRS